MTTRLPRNLRRRAAAERAAQPPADSIRRRMDEERYDPSPEPISYVERPRP